VVSLTISVWMLRAAGVSPWCKNAAALLVARPARARGALLRLQRLGRPCVGRRHGWCNTPSHLHSPAGRALLGERLNGRCCWQPRWRAGVVLLGRSGLLAPARRQRKKGGANRGLPLLAAC